MNSIINDKEIIFYLASLFNYSHLFQEVEYSETNTNEAISWSLERKNKLHKFREKIKNRIQQGIETDTNIYLSKILEIVNHKKQINLHFLKNNLNAVLERLGEDKVIENYKNSTVTGFCKSPGLIINSNSNLIRRKNYTDYTQDCLFRNMEGNENMLITKMENNWPFWFIDTGYTNFLNGKRKDWHRLVRNNLHHSNLIDTPADRLGMFESFPKPWRESGDKILIIEPGEFCARTFGININQWKKDVEIEIRKYTDKKIVIREKLNKKVRKSLYKELCDEDYYCIISINSNAATESIWAGIPAITLHRHISNPVTKNSISDINNLYRGNIANWLCSLSYSQFTYEEIINGTAVNIVKKYHV